MRKTLTISMIVLMAMMLSVSCEIPSKEETLQRLVSIEYGGEVISTVPVQAGEEYTLPYEVDGIDDLTGWNIDGISYDVGETIKITSDITIVAVTKTEVPVTVYDLEVIIIELKNGQLKFNLPDKPKRDGYEFDGWDVSGTTKNPGDEVTYKKGMTIKALWTKIYRITYDANGGTGSVSPKTIREDSAAVSVSSAEGLERNYLVFTSWNTKPDGTGEKYMPGDKYMQKADITLYAMWAEKITVTYYDGTRKLKEVNDAPENIRLWDGINDDGTPVIRGKALDGWYSEDNGGGTYYTEIAEQKSDISLYGHFVTEGLSFSPNSDDTYTVNVQDDSIVSATVPAVYHGKKVTVLGTFSCSGVTAVTFEKAENIIAMEEDRSSFMGCSSLMAIDLSQTGIRTIENQAFRGCTSLISINLPPVLETISNNAFTNCPKLESITLPAGLTTIGVEAFSRSGLKTVMIPENVTLIGPKAFLECASLETVEIRGKVKSLLEQVFGSCTKLTSLILPEALETISRRVIYNTPLLTSITVPKNIKTIDGSAFEKSSLTAIHFESSSIPSGKPWGASSGVKVDNKV